MSPEWDDEEPRIEPEVHGLGEPFAQWNYPAEWNYPDSSGSQYFTTSYTTATPDWSTVLGGSIINITSEGIIYKPTESTTYSPVTFDLSEASWKLTFKVALSLFLSPILCILSRLKKKRIGL